MGDVVSHSFGMIDAFIYAGYAPDSILSFIDMVSTDPHSRDVDSNTRDTLKAYYNNQLCCIADASYSQGEAQ